MSAVNEVTVKPTLETAGPEAEAAVVTAALHWREAHTARLEQDNLTTMVAEMEADMELMAASTKLVEQGGGF